MKSFSHIIERESGLQRHLSAGQMTMIAIGGAIGTGLFLGSGFAIGFAGPSVILSYAIGALVALLLMGCLAEMTVAHPTAGSFGAYAEHFISPLAGFLVRYAYWAAVVLAISCIGIAVAMVLNLWKPEQAFLLMMAISMFGAMFTWFTVFVTHWFFRRQRQLSQAPALPFQMWGFPWLTLLGAALMLAILLTTLLVPQFRMTLLVGVPFLLALTIAYQVHYRHRAPAAAAPVQE